MTATELNDFLFVLIVRSLGVIHGAVVAADFSSNGLSMLVATNRGGGVK